MIHAGTGTREVRERRGGRVAAIGASGLLALAVLTSGFAANADEYEPSNAGHPLRIIAYVVHPVGVAYNYLLLRPAYWVGSHDPFRTLFGRTD